MAGIIDEFDSAVGFEKPGAKAEPAPMPTPRPTEPLMPVLGKEVITGDFAKTQAPSLGLAKKPPILEEFDSELDGESRTRPMVVTDPGTVKALKERPKSVVEEFDQELETQDNPLSVKGYEPKEGTGFVHTALTVLSADEHAMVWGIFKAAGLPEQKNFSDYTYTTLLKEMGMPKDSLMTDAAGLALSIVGSPSTYLTFGESAALKIGAKTAKTALTKEGKKLVNAIVKERAEKEIAERAAKVSTGRLSEDTANMIRRKHLEQAELEVQKRFGEIHKANKQLEVGEDIAALPARIKDKGGIAVEVPFSGRKHYLTTFEGAGLQFMGKEVLTGAEVASAIQKSGLPKVLQTVKQSELGQTVQRSYAETKDLLGKMFIPNYGMNKDLVHNWEETERRGRDVQQRITRMTDKYFAGLTKAQREDFAESAIQASRQTEKVQVSSLKGDSVVQERLDRWFGQGKYEGRTSTADRLAKWSELVEDKKLANWFPGIDRRMEDVKLKLPEGKGPASREFLKSRSAIDQSEKYTRDPVKAVSYRATEVAFAKLQDQFHKRIVDLKLGDARAFKTAKEAADAGYAPLTRPLTRFLRGDQAVDETVYYAKKEFVDQYNQLVNQKSVNISVISYATNLWKAHVTSMFPAFHARNFNANIVLNAMRIGGHAVPFLHPKKHKAALDIVRGVNMEKTIVTEIGEKLSLAAIHDEAVKEGVIRGGQYVADIGGELLDSDTRGILDALLTKANPLSTQFAPSMWGRRFGEAVETQARLVNYMTWRQKGLSPKMAAKETAEALYDYGQVTQFEQYAKHLIPFYTFSRKNLENYTKVMAHRPGAVSAQMKFFRDLGPTETEWEDLPEHAKKSFVVKMNRMFMTGFGLPMEDIVNLAESDMREMILRTNPIFRYPIERAAKVDFFSGRKLSEVNSAKEFGPMLRMMDKYPALRAALEPAQKWLRLEEDKHGKVIGNPDALHILRSSFTSRWQSMVGMLEDDERAGYETALRFLTGIIRLKDDPDAASSIARNKAIEEGKEILQKRNTIKVIPGFIIIKDSGEKPGFKAAQRFQEKSKKVGQDPSYYKDLVRELDDETAAQQDERTLP
jgi:hypothetical protein